MKDPIPSQSDPSRDKEPVTLESVCTEIDRIATDNRSSNFDTPTSKSGITHQMPDYDMLGGPEMGTSVRVAVLTKEGEEPVRLVYTLFYASGADRGTTGYEIHTDGRVLSFSNGELAGMDKDDDPDRYQRRLEEAAAMLAERERDLGQSRETSKPSTIRERLGRFVRELVES